MEITLSKGDKCLSYGDGWLLAKVGRWVAKFGRWVHSVRQVPEIIDPVFAKTSPKRSFQWLNTSVLGLFSRKRGSINSGTEDINNDVECIDRTEQDNEDLVLSCLACLRYFMNMFRCSLLLFIQYRILQLSFRYKIVKVVLSTCTCVRQIFENAVLVKYFQ